MKEWLLKPIRERNPIIVALVGLVIMLGMGSLAYAADSLPVIGGGTTYSANFTESAGLSPGTDVRIAGVKVGKVTAVSLEGGHVKVAFKVKDAWIGNQSTASIMIRTLLGDKYLAVDPLGAATQDPDARIPVSRTTAPYDVQRTFQQLGQTFQQIDAAKWGQSLEAISAAFRNTPPNVRKSAEGLAALSRTISSRDAKLARLLAGTRKITGTLASQNAEWEALIRNGNLLLGELQRRRDAIHGLLVGTAQLGQELTGIVNDNERQIGPMLRSLDQVTATLKANQSNLDQALRVVGPYFRLLGNTLGNGRWFDGYLCGLVPEDYAPNAVPDNAKDGGCMPPNGGGS